MRKSSSPQKLIAGNSSKYDSYREAWSRIKLAQENDFFLEAITIQESLISDRLISYLSRPTASNPLSKDKKGHWPSFSNLIKSWRSEFPNGLQVGSYTDLISAVDQWRKVRNEAIHAIVKSEPGQPTQPIDLFLTKAKEAAEQGERLAREICNWCTKEKRREAR
ncbi:MAG TPA: hypothetical protein V6C90_25495 [Coleofasciculaceae cyanobacterium]|jgi:hypothetical protein